MHRRQWLSAKVAAEWVEVILAAANRPYPAKLDHIIQREGDWRAPAEQHPLFWGCLDWHSSVHMHASLLALRARFPDAAWIGTLEAHFAQRFSAAAAARELDYLRAPGRAAFERPYGWAWLLELHRRCAADRGDALGRDLAGLLAPLATTVAERWLGYLPRADFPNRAGTHGNSAFALVLTHAWAVQLEQDRLRALVETKSRAWFGADRAWPVQFEPSGEDFLSPGLTEAALMRCCLDMPAFRHWWQQFRPPGEAWHAWLQPVAVSDRSDARIAHLDGLNFSRAWCWRQLYPALDPVEQSLVAPAITTLLAASWPAVAGDYMGSHWLASFALLASGDAGPGA